MEALFITRKDIVEFTSLNGNVDSDKFIQWCKVAQDIWIQEYLGSKLFNKLKSDIVANSLSGNYLSLVTTYIKPMIIHWTMVEFLPFAAYDIAQKGIFKHNSENAETVDKSEIEFLTEKHKKIAQHYSQRCIDYIIFNQSLFPEYNTNTQNDIFPQSTNYSTNWYL